MSMYQDKPGDRKRSAGRYDPSAGRVEQRRKANVRLEQAHRRAERRTMNLLRSMPRNCSIAAALEESES